MSLQVLGVGLPRTGTKSLTRALEILGLRTIHYHPDRLIDMAERGDWKVYDNVDAAADFPASAFYRDILHAYPGTRCILTVRPDHESWVDSVMAHGDAIMESPVIAAYKVFAERVGRSLFGRTDGSRRSLICCYRRWVERVQTDPLILPGRLLVLDIIGGDGWKPLCDFLGLPMPAPEVPFPWENRRSST
jgi:hypothetical protein